MVLELEPVRQPDLGVELELLSHGSVDQVTRSTDINSNRTMTQPLPNLQYAKLMRVRLYLCHG